MCTIECDPLTSHVKSNLRSILLTLLYICHPVFSTELVSSTFMLNDLLCMPKKHCKSTCAKGAHTMLAQSTLRFTSHNLWDTRYRPIVRQKVVVPTDKNYLIFTQASIQLRSWRFQFKKKYPFQGRFFCLKKIEKIQFTKM